MRIHRADVEGRLCDVRIEGDRVADVAPALERLPGESEVDARGGALVPGLHDHHVHLLAMAAARGSVACGPPEVRGARALERALAAAPGGAGGWVRGVGYHESVAGELDRRALDAWRSDQPVRIQHRSGSCWFLNGRAIEALGLDRGADAPGVERDARGSATGRVFRSDDWLRGRWPVEPPDLGPVGGALARAGIVGATDATATNDAERARWLARAQAQGDLPQRLHLLGTADLEVPEGLTRGAVKLLLDDARLPDPDALAVTIGSAHRAGRNVAIHCVTRGELAMAIAVWRMVGARRGDRVEHANVCPPDLAMALAELGVTAVIQPGLLHERGDAWLRDVEPSECPWLVRGRGLEESGVALAGGTDAPYGPGDPWLAMRTATTRRTREGGCLGPGEALTPERALALFTTSAGAPGGPPRRVARGALADLCLLDRPWSQARTRLIANDVRATFVGGECVYCRDGDAW